MSNNEVDVVVWFSFVYLYRIGKVGIWEEIEVVLLKDFGNWLILEIKMN